ncbi:MAG TPA: HNH endonuclease [Symbiobacteriaceae bacterium]|nr:HNH endonuclease [Symbiobacteriaceae bacterium]
MRVLEEQHQNRCVYCDTPGSATTIEHYYPKKQFPGLMFEWLNLTLACDACQRYKGQPLEFCGAWPLVLDPANETVEPFLYISPEDGRMMAALELQEGELAYKRATETIGRLRLNERWLPRLRLRVVLELRTALESFRRNPGVETEAGILHMLSPEQPWGAVAWQLMTTPEGEFISLVEFCREHSEAVKRCVSRTA